MNGKFKLKFPNGGPDLETRDWVVIALCIIVVGGLVWITNIISNSESLSNFAWVVGLATANWIKNKFTNKTLDSEIDATE